MALTEQQQQFALDNIKIVYAFIYRHRLDPDEWVDRLIVKYLELIEKYDASKQTSLCTYMFHCFNNELRQDYRKYGYSISVDSLDRDIDSTEGITLHHIIADGHDNIQEVEDRLLITQIIQYVKIKYPDRFELFIDNVIFGKKQTELCQKYGYTQAHISRILNKIRNDIRRTFSYGR